MPFKTLLTLYTFIFIVLKHKALQKLLLAQQRKDS